MKLVTLFALVLAGFVFAADHQLGHLGAEMIEVEIAGDDVICSQPFDFGNLQNGLGFSANNSWMMADDFDVSMGGYIDFLEIWTIYAGGPTGAYNLQVREDSGAGPGAVAASTTSSSVTNWNTGFVQWGYQIYFSEVELTDDLPYTAGTKYWFAAQTSGSGPDYWLCTNNTWGDMSYWSGNNGTSWNSSAAEFGVAYCQYFILTGEYTSLSRDSWGAIKTLF